MIVLGIVLMFLAWAIPQIFPAMVPPFPALCHIGGVAGIILLVLGIVLLILGFVTPLRYGSGRRHLY